MKLKIVRHVMTVTTLGSLQLAALFGPGLIATNAGAKEREDLPPALATPYCLDQETRARDTDVLDIYTVVLRWHGPPRGQLRWLDDHLLPDRPASTESARLSGGTVEALLARLGKRFRQWNPDGERNKPGGRLQLSNIHMRGPDTARVVVRYELMTAYSRGPEWEQVFVLTRRPEGWRIVVRGGARS